MSRTLHQEIEMWPERNGDPMMQINIRLYNAYDLTPAERRRMMGNAVDQIMLNFSGSFPVRKMRVRSPKS